jgi:hypothetical protein
MSKSGPRRPQSCGTHGWPKSSGVRSTPRRYRFAYDRVPFSSFRETPDWHKKVGTRQFKKTGCVVIIDDVCREFNLHPTRGQPSGCSVMAAALQDKKELVISEDALQRAWGQYAGWR